MLIREGLLDLLLKLSVDSGFLEALFECRAAEWALDTHGSGLSEAGTTETMTALERDRLDHNIHADSAGTLILIQLNFLVFSWFHLVLLFNSN